ncbi:MAG: NAD-dependent epimerase/dehydratase family protein [Elusimicrobia bacterium]|nr:NAD-dependent epimerase/dehydratase family protein [Candidatus Liberimonas magnetica]
MKILLTGANGFVGSNIAEELIENGHEVLALVRRTSFLGFLKNLPIKYYYGDMCTLQSLVEPVKHADVIIHNAGVVRAFSKDAYFQANQTGTRNLVETILQYNPKIKKLIYISSQAAMGPSTSALPKTLTEQETPVSDYGTSKLAGEKEVEILKNKVPYTILRPSSVYGPRDKDIFIFFKLINYHLRPYPIKKSYFQLVFVKDLAKFAVDSILNKKAINKTYFISDEKPYALFDVGKVIAGSIGKFTFPVPVPSIVFHLTAFFCETASKITGRPAVLNKQKIREMERSFWLADNSQTKKDFSIGFTNLEIGAKITYTWYKDNNWL